MESTGIYWKIPFAAFEAVTFSVIENRNARMKTIVYSLLILIGLVTAHVSISNNSRKIASDYAIPYVEMSNEDAYKDAYNMQSESSRELDRILQQTSVSPDSIALQKRWHYQKYVSTYVEPIQDKINIVVGIFFSLGYMILAFLAGRVFYRWMQADGGRIIFGSLRRLWCFPIKILGNLGLKTLFLNHQLKVAETEFLRLKSLFDNGLITENEFLTKKAEIERKIRSENLLNR